MKKFLPLLLASVLVSGSFTACGQKKAKVNATPEGNTASEQKNENYEDALRECFNASFSVNGGQVFYAYMYPDEYINDMKDKGDYNEVINQFNYNQEQRPDLTDGVFEFGTVTEADAIDDGQREAVKSYFVEKCKERGLTLTEDDINVGDGYEVKYTYTKNGEEAGTDLALAVEINDQGWKVIPS